MNAICRAPVNELGLTESQREIAEDLGWGESIAVSPFRELTEYIDQVFSKMTSSDPVWFQFPAPQDQPGEGEPFYAINTQYTRAVTREYVGGKAKYKSDYSIMQASEDYQGTLSSLIQYLTRGREAAVYVKVTDMPRNYDLFRRSIITASAAECDIFLPTGLSKGLSRRNGAHITDSEVFSSIISDYIKVMSLLQKRGYELCAHFYLTRGCDIQRILADPGAAYELWAEGGYRDYRCVTITAKGELLLQFRQEIEEQWDDQNLS